MVSVTLLVVSASAPRPYSAANTILVVAGTLLLITVIIFLSVKVSGWRDKRRPETRVRQPHRDSAKR